MLKLYCVFFSCFFSALNTNPLYQNNDYVSNFVDNTAKKNNTIVPVINIENNSTVIVWKGNDFTITVNIWKDDPIAQYYVGVRSGIVAKGNINIINHDVGGLLNWIEEK
jgi:hypothetical protein